ncbi:FAD-dependent oxidoreductase [Acholeplasma granularum]|uniref:FAD-dependent oxidoreductase n=1 Tax=Acholeplasma granularum TaxID=264635 RepID=UPI0004B40E55|nr:FAD-dependent oxidoreductase [Acholeplasma granularum]
MYDVIVCGAGPSGLVAAIAAKRQGMKVLLLESSGLIGGSTTQSLVSPWMTFTDNGKQVNKGIAEEIVSRLVKKGYSLGHIDDPIGFCDTITPIDIEGVKSFFFELIEEEDIDLLLHAFLFDCEVKDNIIKKIKVTTKSGILELEAHVFIDATGDGDLSYLAKNDFIIGKGDNLSQPMTMMFHLDNVDISKIKTYIKNNPSDFHIERPYNKCYTAGSGFFSLVQKAKELNDFDLPRDRVLFFEELKPNQVSINMTRVQNKSGLDAYELTQAEIEGRKQIQKAHQFLKKYVEGFENSYIIRTPSKIGVRETRHIKGIYTLTKEDVLNNQTFDDSICVASFPIDIHAPKGDEMNLFNQRNIKAYEIPLRTLIPTKTKNLVVTGRCISATHEANASLRVTASVMSLGQAAGTLSSLAVKNKIYVKDVDYKEVQENLIKNGQIIKI